MPAPTGKPEPLGPAFDPRDATPLRPATSVKISRSRAGHLWVTVRSLDRPEIVERELFQTLDLARAASRVLRAAVEKRVMAAVIAAAAK